jgi:hypothetical protein
MYDLGFVPAKHQELKSMLPWAHVRKFNFSHYPPFFNVTVDEGQYAWKAAILHEVTCIMALPSFGWTQVISTLA